MKLIAVFSQFPRYDETFLLRELCALRKAGVELEIFSFRRCRDEIVHDRAKDLIPSTTYLPWVLSLEVVLACAYWIFKKPATVLNLIAFFLCGLFRSPVETAKNFLLFPKSMAFAKRMQGRNMEFVHGFWATYPATCAKVIADLLQLPWGFSAHAHDIYTPNALLREKLDDCSLVMTCTEVNHRHLAELCPAAAEQIHTVYHGLDLSRFSREHKSKAEDCGKFRIVSVGSLFVCKGYPALFKALVRLVERGVDVSIMIVGDGPERDKLEALAEELGVAGRISFAGYRTEDEMPRYYLEADVFVLTAVAKIHWGIPNVVVESLACDTPVVVTGLPSLIDVFGADMGDFLLEPADEDELAEAAAAAIMRLYENPELAAQLGRKGRERVEELFDTDRCGRIMLALFQSAVEGKVD